MQKVTLNIKDSAYDKIIYFLQNFSNDVEIINHSTKELQRSKKLINLKGVLINTLINQELQKKKMLGKTIL